MTGDVKLPRQDIANIILAAGSSSRLGHPKQLAEYGGRSLISRAAESASDAHLGPVIVVTSPELGDAIRERISTNDVEIVLNTESQTGMSSSIRAGLSFAVKKSPDLAAVILALCDQPMITSDTFSRLAEAFRREESSIVASAYSETLGVPALFDRSMFDELLALTGDHGAKSLIMSRQEDVAKVAAPEAAIDIDSVDDIDRLNKKRPCRTVLF